MNKRDVLKVITIDKENALKALPKNIPNKCPEMKEFQNELEFALKQTLNETLAQVAAKLNVTISPKANILCSEPILYHNCWDEDVKINDVSFYQMNKEFCKNKQEPIIAARKQINEMFTALERQILLQGFDAETVTAIQGFSDSINKIVNNVNS